MQKSMLIDRPEEAMENQI